MVELNNDRTYFFSVDPGFSNVGVVVGYFTELGDQVDLTIEANDTWDLVSADKFSVDQLIPKMKNMIEYYPQLMTAQKPLILIENQYLTDPRFKTISWHLSTKLYAFQAIFMATIVNCWGFDVTAVNSKSYKTSLGLSGKNYAENKNLALEFCTKKLGCKKKDLNHHIADAFNQLYYTLTNLYPGKTINISM